MSSIADEYNLALDELAYGLDCPAAGYDAQKYCDCEHRCDYFGNSDREHEHLVDCWRMLFQGLAKEKSNEQQA